MYYKEICHEDFYEIFILFFYGMCSGDDGTSR